MSSLPDVSCFCCTYGRPALLEEAIESFLRQDYKGKKELIVLNDFDGHRLFFKHPEVQVINSKTRIMPLGKKFNLAAEYCSGEVLFPWEDDDVYLPWRISYSIANLKEGLFHTHQGWLEHTKGQLSLSQNLYQCNFAISKSRWLDAGGYREEDVSSIDLDLYRRLNAQQITQNLPAKDVFYVYRWHTSDSYHASSAGGNASGISDNVGALVKAMAANGDIPLGDVQLKPQWRSDWVEMARAAQSSINKQRPNDQPVAATEQSEDRGSFFPAMPGLEAGASRLIYFPTKNVLQLLDQYSASFWLGLLAGLTEEQIANKIAAQIQARVNDVLADLRGCKQQWLDQNLLTDWQEPLFLKTANSMTAIIIEPESLREKVKRIVPGLIAHRTENWDEIIEIKTDKNFYSLFINGKSQYDLLYEDTAIQQLLTELNRRKNGVTQHPIMINTTIVNTGKHVVAISVTGTEEQATIALYMQSQGYEVLSFETAELTPQLTLRNITGEISVSHTSYLKHEFLSENYEPVFSSYVNDQVRHYLPVPDKHIELTDSRPVDAFIFIKSCVDQSSDPTVLSTEQALDILIRSLVMPVKTLKQHQLQAVIKWLQLQPVVLASLASLDHLKNLLHKVEQSFIQRGA